MAKAKAFALAKVKGLGFSDVATYASRFASFDNIRFHAKHPVLGQFSFGLVFKERSTDVSHVEYSKPSGHLLVPLLTETDGRGVRFDSDGTASWRPEPGADGGFQYAPSVFTRKFHINNQDVDLSFCDWLRNHDVTANNFMALSIERQLELFAAFLNCETFGINPDTGDYDLLEDGNDKVENIRLRWAPSGRLNYLFLAGMPGPPSWLQEQVGTNDLANNPWLAVP